MSETNEDDFICGERSLKEDIINLVQSKNKKLELSHFLSATIKSVRAKIVLGEIFSDDDCYCIYFDEKTQIETFLSMKTQCNLKKQPGLVSSNGNSWAGWDKKEGIYLRYDDTIKNNDYCMKIIEITGFEELEEVTNPNQETRVQETRVQETRVQETRVQETRVQETHVQETQEVTKPNEEDDILMCEKMEKMSLACNIDSIEFQIYSIISTELIKKNDKYRDILSNTPEFSKSVIDRFKTQSIILSQNATTKIKPTLPTLPKTQTKLTTKTNFPDTKKTALFFLISLNPTHLESIIAGKTKFKTSEIKTCIQNSKDDLVRYNAELTAFTKSCPDYISKKTNAYIEFCKEFKSLTKDPKQMWKVVNQDTYKDLLSNDFKSFIKHYTK